METEQLQQWAEKLATAIKAELGPRFNIANPRVGSVPQTMVDAGFDAATPFVMCDISHEPVAFGVPVPSSIQVEDLNDQYAASNAENAIYAYYHQLIQLIPPKHKKAVLTLALNGLHRQNKDVGESGDTA